MPMLTRSFAVLALLASLATCTAQSPAKPKDGEAKEYFFCFWNVENLFDDKDDKRNTVDEEYDDPFAENAELRKLKLDRLTSAILKMNDGNGPDILACCEVESVRAGELLMNALNAKLKDAKKDDLLYKFLLMQNLDAGRHIAPCVITRVPCDLGATRLNKNKLRILETHLKVNGHDLCLVATHWTSQLKQTDGSSGDEGRNKYANTIFDRFRQLNKDDIHTDYFACGDFNDSPDADPIVKNLGAIGDKTKVKPGNDPKEEPFFLNLMNGKDPAKFGTIWYDGKPKVYDQICVAPGLIDNDGWSVDPSSIATITEGLIRKGATRREPWRFGDPKRDLKDSERGFSDHFPVTCKLKVAAKAAK